ncbi:hypothetical protein F0267_00550 [Vibrio coralliilyticus]|uniref:Uncharacterized protein n=1 Tax=Vibrio coralliilyticus TaxID=190893 RepID=A0AAN0W148_9VIBR|nr:hypothetical protein [Vibrio coralliilyticus]AIW22613.1 hypothetical protein IX92_26485 [Vibrio coralliilyticus]NOH36709.1 hypothetical protein [Vibrio coralliilyticus]
MNKISKFKEKIQVKSNGLQAEINSAKSVIEDKYLDTKNSVQCTVDTVSGFAAKTAGAIIGVVDVAVSIGIVFAAFTAPVPAAIGGAIILLGTRQIGNSFDEVNAIKSKNKSERELGKAVQLLKKYGSIPKTAIVETDFLSVTIHAETNTVSGVVRQGTHSGKYLSELSDVELTSLIEHAPNSDTQDILEAYSKYRSTQSNSSREQ